jgi:hypothetical protein
MSRRDRGIDLADRLLRPQAAGMSCYSADLEITSICADFLVELRGFEPMAIAVQSPVRYPPLSQSDHRGPLTGSLCRSGRSRRWVKAKNPNF